MDPLTALSVAGNVVQFVDFALKVVSKGHQIYKSNDGSLAENSDLELVTSDLLVLQSKLECCSSSSKGEGGSTEDNEAIAKLVAASNDVAKELLQRLNMAKAQGRFRRWKSLRQAVKSVWGKGEVEEMAKRLSMFRDELQTRIIVSLSAKLEDSDARNETATKDSTQRILDTIQAKCAAIGDKVDANTHVLISAVEDSDILLSEETSDFFGRESGSKAFMTDLLNHDAQVETTPSEIENAILRAFEYPSMEARHEIIPEAYEQTFTWILEDPDPESEVPWDNFMEWLREGEDLYWIKGKAASGKSTLMKYILQQSEVQSQLRRWAGERDFLSVEFFFWNLGTPQQKSQLGLLMTLLRKIFHHQRELIPIILPELWQTLSNKTHAELKHLRQSWQRWSVTNLKRIFDDLMGQAAVHTRFCVFIDGLDEFDGSHAEIAAIFSKIASLSNIKVCISSRPLTTFEYEFSGCKTLQLQDLTAADIQHYVQARLNSHRHFARLSQNDPTQASSLIQEVVGMSSGVFLWVFLVVKSLLDGLTNLDMIVDLQKRLHELPPELDDLYSVMLRSINPPFYRAQASRLIQIAYQAEFPISAVYLSFADDPSANLALTAKVEALPLSEIRNRVQAVTNRLKSRCMGLLEVQEYSSYSKFDQRNLAADHPHAPQQVQYLHLTVKEFLEKPEVWTEIIERTADSDFDSSVACLRGLITMLKTTVCYHGWGRRMASLVDRAISFARQAENSTGQAQVALVDEIDRAATFIHPEKQLSHWSADYSALHASCCIESCVCGPSNLLAYAIGKGLTLYVQAKFGESLVSLNQQSHRPLLDYSTGVAPTFNHSLSVTGVDETHPIYRGQTKVSRAELLKMAQGHLTSLDQRPIPSMVALLLRAGLDPNEQRDHSTPWKSLLKNLRDNISISKDGVRQAWVDVCRLFLIYGANVWVTIPAGRLKAAEGGAKGAGPPLTVRNVMKAVFSHLPSKIVQELDDLVVQRCTDTTNTQRGKRKAPEPRPLPQAYEQSRYPQGSSWHPQSANRGRKRGRS